MNSPIQLQVVSALARRNESAKRREKMLQRWDNRGTVQAKTDRGYRVKTALGNTFYVRQGNVNTNGNVVGQNVVAVRPRLGSPFIDGAIRG